MSTRREKLTLTQLAGYDDILTDALVDHVSIAFSYRDSKGSGTNAV